MAKKEKELTIEDLPGVGPSTADKLREGGFPTLLEIGAASPAELTAIGGLGETTAIKAIEFAREVMKSKFDLKTAGEVLEYRKEMIRVPTGIKGLDELLGGGIESQAITEFYGSFGSGKSQLAHMACVQALKQFPDKKVVYIDTENSFRPNRLVDFARGSGVDEELIKTQVVCATSFNSSHQIILVDKVEDMLKNKEPISLLVVDSFMSHFRGEFVGRATLSDRQTRVTKAISQLAKLATVYNVAVVITNQVMTNPGQLFGDPTMPIGGNMLGHTSKFRIYLRRGKKGSRVASLVDAPDLPDGECNFFVESEGFKDAWNRH